MSRESRWGSDSETGNWRLGSGWTKFMAAVAVAVFAGLVVNWDTAKKKENSDFRQQVASFDAKFSAIELKIVQLGETLKTACDKIMEFSDEKKRMDNRLDEMDGRLNRVESKLR